MVVVDDVNVKKLGIMHAILSNFKCDWAKHIYDCLEYFVTKAGVEEGDKQLSVNVGYGFMLFYLLKLKGITLKLSSEVQLNTYLFKTS